MAPAFLQNSLAEGSTVLGIFLFMGKLRILGALCERTLMICRVTEILGEKRLL